MICRCTKAFTLVEILLVMLLIGVFVRYLPRWVRRAPSAEWSHVHGQLNNLMYVARQEATAKQQIYRLVFDAPKDGLHAVYIQSEKDDPENPDKKQFVPVYGQYFNSDYKLAQSIKIKAVYHNGKEQLTENKQKAYCYVMHNGLVQDVLIHMNRFENNQKTQAYFNVEPFLATFNYHKDKMKLE